MLLQQHRSQLGQRVRAVDKHVEDDLAVFDREPEEASPAAPVRLEAVGSVVVAGVAEPAGELEDVAVDERGRLRASSVERTYVRRRPSLTTRRGLVGRLRPRSPVKPRITAGLLSWRFELRSLRAVQGLMHLRSDQIRRSESGQTIVEYALIVATIAVVCVAATVFLSDRISDLFGTVTDSPAINRPTPGSLTPPTPPIQWPTRVSQCLHGRWRNYPQFADQASCIRYVAGRR